MICPRCKGEGKMIAPFQFTVVPCPDCLGSRIVDDHYPQWHEIGQAIRASRLERGETMREAIKRTGLDALAYSRMERGLIDPAPLQALEALEEEAK